MTEPLQPASPDALPTLTQVARVEGVSVPLIQPVKTPRGGRARWAIALVATLVVVLVAGGLVAFAGAGAASVGPAYAPSDALLYMDIRGDLPGDQRQQLATFMAHFPGFADPSSLQTKLDQALDKLVSKATNGTFTYSGNIEPWFGGQVAVAVGPSDSVVLVVSVSDSAGLPTKLDQTSQQLAKQLGGSVAIDRPRRHQRVHHQRGDRRERPVRRQLRHLDRRDRRRQGRRHGGRRARSQGRQVAQPGRLERLPRRHRPPRR